MDALNDFLHRYGLFEERRGISGMVGEYIKEMQRGLNSSSSLKMIPSYIKLAEVKKDTPVCVIDAGGSNLRAARAVITDDGFTLLGGAAKTYTPGSAGTVTKDEFFSRVADLCLPFVKDGDAIAFSFSFPAEILPSLDARVIVIDKELKISGIRGALVGEGLKNALFERGVRDIRALVINDAVATCLSGMATGAGGACTGTIIGTGLNTCYFEDMKNIGKLGSGEGRMIINTESGGYAGFERNDIDIEYSKTLKEPDGQITEQMVSGGYLGALVKFTLERAAREKVIRCIQPFELGTVDVDEFLRYRSGVIAKSVDKRCHDAAEKICAAVTGRAARLAAVEMAAAVVKTGEKSALLAVEGSTYYKLCGFREKVESILEEYFSASGIKAKTAEIENAVLKGCAIAALMCL